MRKKKKRKYEDDWAGDERGRHGFWSSLQEGTRNSIVGILLVIISLVLFLAAMGSGGYLGNKIYSNTHFLFGVGYYAIPLLFLLLAVNFFRKERGGNFTAPALVAGPFFILSTLGLLALVDTTSGTSGLGGWIGYFIASPTVYLFAPLLSGIILAGIFVIAILILFDTPLHLGFMFSLFSFWKTKKDEKPVSVSGVDLDDADDEDEPPEVDDIDEEDAGEDVETEDEPPKIPLFAPAQKPLKKSDTVPFRFNSTLHSTYTPPPLSLLAGDKGKPGYGDIKANANIIKRTFQNFGLHVEMDEVSVGPSITRYALKPAEGVRLSKITALQHDLELALAAAPIRIEAPIPGKSLVGIEMPNSTKSTVGLGTLLSETLWSENANPLFVPLGKGISGVVHFMNIAKMPHVLVAGATGSGKSVSMHTMITSLLYRNSPEQLRFIMVDPKRVELTSYNGIPHLLTPVITEAKKATLTLKGATREMDRRYDVLQEEKCRDIDSYHKGVLRPALEKYEKQKTEGKFLNNNEESELPELMPYIVIIIDELADIMSSYPRELESAIVLLAQMSRAVGIHLILSTQRPEVNIITGLIKANIPARIALKVSSQIDSRTILDIGGAEKLLGAGDMLYSSGEAQPERLQSAFISETEVKKVVKYLADEYKEEISEEIALTSGSISADKSIFESTLEDEDSSDDDELYEEARACVIEAGRASTYSS